MPQGTLSPEATTRGDPSAAVLAVGQSAAFVAVGAARTASPATMANAMRRAGMGADPSGGFPRCTPLGQRSFEKVSQLAGSPESNPRRNHLVRCSEDPCVHVSGLI